MLTASTAKANDKACEATLDIVFDSDVYNIKYAVQEFNHPGLLFQEILHLFIFSVMHFILLKPSGVQYPPAIKNKTSSITGDVLRNSFFVTKAVDAYNQWSLIIGFQWRESLDDFIGNANVQHPSEFRNCYSNILVRDELFQIF